MIYHHKILGHFLARLKNSFNTKIKDVTKKIVQTSESIFAKISAGAIHILLRNGDNLDCLHFCVFELLGFSLSEIEYRTTTTQIKGVIPVK